MLPAVGWSLASGRWCPMAMGKRPAEQQPELFLPVAALPQAPGHPFYRRLNHLLAEAGFDRFCEDLCRPFFAEDLGRPSVPPGVYFRMLFVGYFEGIDSHRGIAWRCADSRSLPHFLCYLPADPDAKVAKMKDGTTHLAYKAEHVVDLKTELVLAAEVYPADQADSATLPHSVLTAELNLARADSDAQIKDVATDRGYHKVETIADFTEAEYKTYIPEPEQVYEHTWQDKPPGQERAYRNNRRRVRGAKGKRLQRLRSERVERSFAHVCETGGTRRSWLRGLVEVSKRYLMQVAAHNLGVLMRRLLKVGTPRGLQGAAGAAL